MTCRMLDTYLEGRLSDEASRRFESHMDICRACRQTVENWRRLRADINALLDEKTLSPSRLDAEHMVRRVREPDTADSRVRGRARQGLRWGLAAAAAGVLIVFIAIAFIRTSDGPRESVEVAVLYPEHYEPHIGRDGAALVASALKGLLVKAGRAEVGLTPGTNARIMRANDEQIQLALSSGTMGVSFSPSPKRASLAISAGPFSVRVVGTLFWVSVEETDCIEVGVTRGEVQVTGLVGSGPVTVSAGYRLVVEKNGSSAVEVVTSSERRRLSAILAPDKSEESSHDAEAKAEAEMSSADPSEAVSEEVRGDDTAPHPALSRGASDRPEKKRADSPDPLPSMEEIETLIVSGELTKATAALEKRLARKPSDGTSRMMLASCYRKTGDYRKAVRELRRIIAKGAPTQQNRARFSAGALYQDKLGQHVDAVRMFDAYLKTKKGLRPNTLEAKMRLARALGQTGNQVRYRAVLENIVEEHGGTEAAAKAKSKLRHLSNHGDAQ